MSTVGRALGIAAPAEGGMLKRSECSSGVLRAPAELQEREGVRGLVLSEGSVATRPTHPPATNPGHSLYLKPETRNANIFFSQKLFMKLFCKIQFPHKSVNLSFILVVNFRTNSLTYSLC